MKSRLYLVTLICIASLYNSRLIAAPDKIQLKTTEATLTIDLKGNLNIVRNIGGHTLVNSPINNLWKITLKNVLTGQEQELNGGKGVHIESINGVINLVKNDFTVGDNKFPVHVNFTISVENDAFRFSGNLRSDSKEWIIKELVYPAISGINMKDKNVKIYWPYRLGEFYDNPREFGSKTLFFPSSFGAMEWFTVNTEETGIYFGSHDTQMGMKNIDLSYSDSDKSFVTSLLFPINENDFAIPDVMVKIYSGNWHNASKFYRSWYNEHFKLATVSEWTKNMTGFTLNILKQQNGSKMWSYNDMDELCDIAERLNFNLIGLWGWGVGGHDRLYPNYMPDNLLGGVDGVKKAIARAHERGFKVIVYSNGTMMDTSTDYYKFNGKEVINAQADFKPRVSEWIKYGNDTPAVHVLACFGSSLWRKTMLDLAKYAQSLGVDAFYIDQVNVRTPAMCFSKNHDHKLPQEVDTKFKLQMMRDIRNEMKKIDPEFSIFTEGNGNQLVTDVDVYHNIGHFPEAIHGFPSLFRYTFPETLIIQLNSSPALSRFDANFNAIYGLIPEIMSRYEPDVKYLKSGVIPVEEDYTDLTVLHYPKINTMNQASPEETASYVHDLVEFQKRHVDYLKRDKFIDDDGIDVKGKDILAKGFLNDNKIGVLVWNQNLISSRSFKISVPGYELIKVSEPRNDNVKATDELEPNSIRLLMFEKNSE